MSIVTQKDKIFKEYQISMGCLSNAFNQEVNKLLISRLCLYLTAI